MSQRTDGDVPALQRTGLAYGENKAVNDQQAAASIDQQPAAAGGGQGGGRGLPVDPERGIWGPTGRPNEPLTAGVDAGAGAGRPASHLPDDPYLAAKALYRLSPTPEMERLIARLSRA